MKKNRLEKINSLLKEILFDVIQKQVKNPHVNLFVTVTKVETSADLYHAKVYISLIGTEAEKAKVLAALESAAGFIAVNASKQARLRHFPSLTFKIDTAAEEHFKIEKILADLEKERQSRTHDSEEPQP